MERKVQKVIYKLIREGREAFDETKKDLQNGIFNPTKVMESVFLSYFDKINLETEVTSDDKEILFYDVAKVVSRVSNLYVNLQDKMAFLNWYLQGFVHFYTNKNIKDYQKLGSTFAQEVQKKLDEEKINYEVRMSCPSPKNILESFFLLSAVAIAMQNLKKLGVPYAEQGFNLRKLGAEESFIQQMISNQIMLIKNKELVLDSVEDKINISEKKSSKEIEEPIDTEVRSKKSLEESNVVEEVSKRSLKEKLSVYFCLDNLSNTKIIEGDELEEVSFLLHQIYTPMKAKHLLEIVLHNNQVMKQERKRKIMELLMNSEDFYLMDDMIDFLNGEEVRDPLFYPYISLVQKIVYEVDSYIESYATLNKEDKEYLQKDYSDLIHMVLSEVKPHLEFLPFYYTDTRIQVKCN